jgi:hypothetical protein
LAEGIHCIKKITSGSSIVSGKYHLFERYHLDEDKDPFHLQLSFRCGYRAKKMMKSRLTGLCINTNSPPLLEVVTRSLVMSAELINSRSGWVSLGGRCKFD